MRIKLSSFHTVILLVPFLCPGLCLGATDPSCPPLLFRESPDSYIKEVDAFFVENQISVHRYHKKMGESFRGQILKRDVISYVAKNNKDQRIAWFTYSIENATTLYLNLVNIAPEYRGRNLSKYFFARMLNDYPNTSELLMELGEDNAAAVNFNVIDHYERIRNTPMYKALSKLGFGSVKETKIVSWSYHNGTNVQGLFVRLSR